MMPKDKVLHFSACAFVAVLASVFALALSATWQCGMLLAVYSGMAAGLGKEFADHLNPNNRWDWWDVVADVCGALTGALIGTLMWSI